jgi:hypothetical protein
MLQAHDGLLQESRYEVLWVNVTRGSQSSGVAV